MFFKFSTANFSLNLKKNTCCFIYIKVKLLVIYEFVIVCPPLNIFITFTYLFWVLLVTPVGGAHMLQLTCGGQRTIFGSWSLLSRWSKGQVTGLGSNHLYPLIHLSSPVSPTEPSVLSVHREPLQLAMQFPLKPTLFPRVWWVPLLIFSLQIVCFLFWSRRV